MQAIIDAQEDRYLPDGTKIDPRNFLFPQRAQNLEDLSLWNDPRWGRVKQNLSKEQIEQYKTIGEQMNGSINFTNGKSNEIPIPEPAKDSIAYILVGLRSGLEIDDLDEEEIKAMNTFVGEDWRERWTNGSLFAEKENTDKSRDKKDSTGDK
jgi:hypothetical protein